MSIDNYVWIVGMQEQYTEKESHINGWGKVPGGNKGSDSTKPDKVELSPLLRQLLKESDISTESLPPEYLRWLEQQAMDGNLVHPETKGEHLTLRTHKSSTKKPAIQDPKGEECGKHEESHKWRKACGRGKNTHSNHADRLQQERENHCPEHHCHAAN